MYGQMFTLTIVNFEFMPKCYDICYMMLFYWNFITVPDVIAKMLVIPHILCQMLYQYMMADIEPILWQMLLPIFNIVPDVITTYYIGC